MPQAVPSSARWFGGELLPPGAWRYEFKHGLHGPTWHHVPRCCWAGEGHGESTDV